MIYFVCLCTTVGKAFILNQRNAFRHSNHWDLKQTPSFTPKRIFCSSSRFSWTTQSVVLKYCSVWHQRVGIEIPLLDVTDSDLRDKMIQPLPSTHLPDEMTTAHCYGLHLHRPVHQLIMNDAVERHRQRLLENPNDEDEVSQYGLFGHVAYRNPSTNETLVGAIGCAAEIWSNEDADESWAVEPEPGENRPQTILCRGSFRFIVRKVIQTIPFPVAIVDELYDIDPTNVEENEILNYMSKDDMAHDDEDDEDDHRYSEMGIRELEERTIHALGELLDMRLESIDQVSPLELSILEETGMSASAQRQILEEMVAVYQVFVQYVLDVCPHPVERFYAISFMVAELADFDNKMRRKLLCMRDGVERLRVVLQELEGILGMQRARRMASDITEEVDDPRKDLQIGTPQLPPWAKQIRKGTKIEYFWNEEEGWCEGEVTEDPVLVVNELVINVYFPDDDSIRKLPFNPDEKARWRPAR